MQSAPPTGVRMLSRFGACLVCRKRKLRCDATQPECNRCRATGHKCEYQDPPCTSKTRVLQDQIKDIEARIKVIEQRRGRTSDPSRAYNSIHSESNVGFGTLWSQLASQATFLNSTPNSSVHKVPTLPSYLAPGASRGLNMLMPRGPSNLSLPGEASRKMLNMFMQRKLASGFELHIGRVLRSFQHGSSESAVPALYYAMLLLGCHFISEPELKFWESMFFERTKLEIETNIARAHSNDTSKYNPLHHLQAMVMLGQWFYFKCRLLEGYVYMTRAMQFAVALGLHELDSRIYGHYVVTNWKLPRRGAGRWSPRDPVELGEAINLWWACLVRDFIGTVLNGLPPSISLEEIKTVWPVSLSDFEDWSGSELSNDNHSIASLFDPEHFHIVTDISKDTANSIVAKGGILICCAGKLDTERISGSDGTDEWWARFEECDRAIQSFSQSARKAYAGRNMEDIVNIALSHTAVDCAIIQLYGPLADYELDIGAQGDPSGLLTDSSLGGYNYTRCIEACRSMVLATAYIEGVDTSHMQMFIGILWSCTARVLAKQVPKLRQNGCMEQAKEMEQHLRRMVKNVERLVLVYPVLSLQAEHLRTLLP
ncbi:fungal specific transcription factor domain protein [Rhizoctonia solani 123E]|uniref:Fungal specific transcription factor domain protein n=1 Tax=Rhizoctonia solani 123E TaxID=1423351 RepID=A0A074RUZ9_9AGAM|nr:fungal specific transcription factor domain protein [Rhizoctonia solani 123E]